MRINALTRVSTHVSPLRPEYVTLWQWELPARSDNRAEFGPTKVDKAGLFCYSVLETL